MQANCGSQVCRVQRVAGGSLQARPGGRPLDRFGAAAFARALRDGQTCAPSNDRRVGRDDRHGAGSLRRQTATSGLLRALGGGPHVTEFSVRNLGARRVTPQ
jgi:hypothetical protein